MIKPITNEVRSRFEDICASLSSPLYKDSDWIGIYNEKRVHRAIKKFVCGDENCFEVKVGRSVADVLTDGTIYEIQTGSFYPLSKKIANYLATSEYEIHIIYPIIKSKRIVRVDRETGEVLRSRLSSAKEKPTKILPELVYLSDVLKNHRLTFEIYSISCEEHRYSDEIHRYRKSGKRDSELFPISLEEIEVLSLTEDFKSLLPASLIESQEFTAKEFMRATSIKNRRAYNALGALVSLGILTKEKSGNEAARFKIV